MTGWRTVSIETPVKLSVSDRQMHLTDMETLQTAMIPLDEIARVVISTHSALLTARLIEQLALSQVSVILCDGKHNPACELLPLSRHDESAGCIMDQAQWTEERKDVVWAEIVRLKISNQICALKKADLNVRISSMTI